MDYALEAAIFVTGAAVQWLRDQLGIIRTADETEELARSLDSNDGVYLVPAFTGLGSPHWDAYARGTLVGLTRGSGRAHLARAALEAMAYQTVDAVRAMEEASGVVLEELKADGGAVVNGWLMKFQADVLGVPVVVPEVSETTALGAAYLAGVATGDVERGRTCARCGGRPLATSRRCRRTRARSCWRAGREPSSAPGVTKRIAPGREAQVKAQVYKDPRPAEHFDRFHERQRTKRPNWMYEVVRLLLTPYLLLFYRARCIDSHNIPADGPVIIAPNHFSFLDHFFVAVYLRRKVQFMAKSQLFKWPMQVVYHNGGVFPVRRGHHDEEAFKTAHAVLARGDIVVMYAEAGRSRTGELGKPRHGIGRLALESGAPVVPTAIAGTERARNWKRLQFPKVTIQFGEPIRFEQVDEPTKEQAQAASEAIFERIRHLHTLLVGEGRKGAIRRARDARRAAREHAEQAAGAGHAPARTPGWSHRRVRGLGTEGVEGRALSCLKASADALSRPSNRRASRSALAQSPRPCGQGCSSVRSLPRSQCCRQAPLSPAIRSIPRPACTRGRTTTSPPLTARARPAGGSPCATSGCRATGSASR